MAQSSPRNERPGRTIEEMAATLLQLISAIVAELHPQDPSPPTPQLDSAFDRDLGLDSLGRIELISRIEAAFEINLPEASIASAETPRDVLVALLKSTGRGSAIRSLATIDVEPAIPSVTPDHATTLTEMLEWHVQRHGSRVHIQLFDDYTDGEVITYQRLWDEASALAGALQYAGLEPGETVALMLPTSREYFFSFFAVVLAGAVPVPIYPPVRRTQLEDHLRRQSGILRNCGASFLITGSDAKFPARLLTAQVESLRSVVTADELRAADRSAEIVRRAGDDIGFLQYTSGSTGDPKGVMLTHANLLANIRADGAAMRASSADVFVSWLPLYHDMGLIGAWFGSLYHAPKLVIMPPLSFLSRPERWLWAVHRYHGTLSAAPNFAFDLCVRRIDDKAIEGLDLSGWRVVANGAEAISPETMDAFCERFAAYGFDGSAMLPVYGLAECAVGLTFSPLGRGPRIETIDREILARDGRATVLQSGQPSAGANALTLVSCGLPLPRHEIRIVDDAGRELPERMEGHLQFRGPSATAGYYRNPEKTAALIKNGWLASGDRAYIAGGELFITGRTKDLIIRAGRNIYPTELEHHIGEIDGIRNGCVAVLGSPDPASGTERLVVIAETRRQGEAQRAELERMINELAIDIVGAPADEVVLVHPNTVLKTSSGKIRRADTRRRYESGQLGGRDRAPWLQMLRLAALGVVPQLHRLRRAAATSMFAAYAWLIFTLLSLCAWFVAIAPLPRRTIWAGIRAVTRTLAFLTRTRVDVVGEPPACGSACIFVANHQSYLDGPLLIAVLDRPVQFVVKRELERSWYLRLPLAHLGVRFVDRFDHVSGIAQMHEAGLDLNGSEPLLVFPEGTFKRMPGLLPFHMGAFATAVSTGAAVVPIAIHGTRSILRAGSWMPRRGAIRVVFGEPIAPATQSAPWPASIALRDAARRQILEHCGEPDLARESNALDRD